MRPYVNKEKVLAYFQSKIDCPCMTVEHIQQAIDSPNQKICIPLGADAKNGSLVFFHMYKKNGEEEDWGFSLLSWSLSVQTFAGGEDNITYYNKRNKYYEIPTHKAQLPDVVTTEMLASVDKEWEKHYNGQANKLVLCEVCLPNFSEPDHSRLDLCLVHYEPAPNKSSFFVGFENKAKISDNGHFHWQKNNYEKYCPSLVYRVTDATRPKIEQYLNNENIGIQYCTNNFSGGVTTEIIRKSQLNNTPFMEPFFFLAWLRCGELLDAVKKRKPQYAQNINSTEKKELRDELHSLLHEEAVKKKDTTGERLNRTLAALMLDLVTGYIVKRPDRHIYPSKN